jgi:hypothetical protein
MRHPLLTPRRQVDVMPVTGAARRAGRRTALAPGALLAALLLAAGGAAVGLRPAGQAGPVRGAVAGTRVGGGMIGGP